jgi:ATP-dependent DNA helicase PIF1
MLLSNKLKNYRKEKSIEKNIQPYCIFSNNTLNDICTIPPQSIDQLILIKGIGPKKIIDYGPDILEICKGETGTENILDLKTVKTCEPNVLPDDLKLSIDQKKALELYDKCENLFITGPGGVGKSYLIYLLVKRYENKKNIQVCGMTGVASELLNCDAKTIHSWSGAGLVYGDENKILKNIMYNRNSVRNWKSVDILIVDEVSMMSKKFFEILDKVGRYIRRVNKPFGGIQLVFSGDFYQLPPVPDKNDKESGMFCFESEMWNKTFKNVVVLHKIFRQKDKTFMKILKQIRKGGITKKTFDILNDKLLNKNNKVDKNKYNPVIMSPIRSIVDSINESNMNKLNTKENTYEYKMVYPTISNESKITINNEANDLEKRLNAPKVLKLKIGANVMCTANIDMESSDKIINGSQGKIIRFDGGLPVVSFKNGITRIIEEYQWKSDIIPDLYISQIPLILSWAITIHKSQGITLESAIIDAGDNIFECGQIYVAFSRVKTLDGLFLANFNHKKIKTNKKVTDYYENLISL